MSAPDDRWLDGAGVLVLGLGASGLAMARWCAARGAVLRLWDSRVRPAVDAQVAAELPGAQRWQGPLDAEALVDVRLVLKSPGLSPFDPKIAPLLERAAAIGLPVMNELDLFVRALADLRHERGYAPKLIAITGTNGKTTTTAMTAALVGRTGRRVAVAGNIGPTMLETLAGSLRHDAVEPPAGETNVGDLPEVWVLELSSFQLDGVRGFEPDAAAVLNLTEDHLDWHRSMDHYAASKARIFGPATLRVLPRNDRAVDAMLELGHDAASRAPTKGRRRDAAPPPPERRFGIDTPRRPGDFGIVQENGLAWLVRANDDEDAPRRVRSRAGAEAEPLTFQRLMPAEALRVRGRHNAANALAALALASAIGCPLAPMLHALRDYAGEPHRLAHVATHRGVDAFDDSKGTNVGATVAALAGLGADRAPSRLVVILGGDGKGQDFGPLAEPVRRHARAVATLGRDAAAIEAALAGVAGVPVVRHPTLEAATRWSFEQALPGDAVLLSPACASLDMFRDYAHRAEVYVAEVHAIVAEAGGLAG